LIPPLGIVLFVFDVVWELKTAVLADECLYRYGLGARPATNVTLCDFAAWLTVSLDTVDFLLDAFHYFHSIVALIFSNISERSAAFRSIM
jgi:hypothetical protein